MVSRWKSRNTEVPKMAAIMMTPKKPMPMSLKMLAYGPFSRTLPLVLPTGPKLSLATLRKLKANQAAK